jgi:transcriptional regulator GlxA family with amidase domain
LRVLSKAFSIKRTNNVLNIFIGVVKMKKISSIADSENKALLAEICNWIDKNTSPNIDWTELIETTGLSHKELQFLFDKYLNTTPMTYIRERRKEKNKVKPNFIITPNFIAKDTD